MRFHPSTLKPLEFVGAFADARMFFDRLVVQLENFLYESSQTDSSGCCPVSISVTY
jgi:hypothetical protein